MIDSNPYQRTILFALPATGRHIYAGTVSPEEVARRRAAGKRARIARRVTRRSRR
jgi:hypothetical protein